MSRKALITYFICAALGAVFTQQAIAWGTGGGVSSPFKVIPGLTLFCDLSDPRSTASIEAIPCAGGVCANYNPGDGTVGGGSGPFVFEGNMVCAEVDSTVPNPSLDDAVDVDGMGGPDIGLFSLNQKVMDAGLAYTGDAAGANGVWSFTVKQGPRDENLFWELTPVPGDPGAAAICTLAPNPANCVGKFGLKEKEKASDYEEQTDGDGNVLVKAGEVFNFATVGGLPQNLNWFPCHTGFDPSADIKCKVNQGGGVKLNTRSEGEIEGVVIVEFEFTPDLNMGNPSESSSLKLVICGGDLVFAPDGSPIDTNEDVLVNGQPVTYQNFSVSESGIGVCAGGLQDLSLQLNRSEVIAAIGSCTDGDEPVEIGGLLIDGRFFEGTGTIAVHNCP